jgi:hypothetical protein
MAFLMFAFRRRLYCFSRSRVNPFFSGQDGLFSPRESFERGNSFGAWFDSGRYSRFPLSPKYATYILGRGDKVGRERHANSIGKEEWKAGLGDAQTFLAQFGGRMPQKIWDEFHHLKTALRESR